MPINTGYPPGANAQEQLNMKPAMGFKLPSAGLSPAPSVKKSRNVENDISL
jgi:hypothetical protein